MTYSTPAHQSDQWVVLELSPQVEGESPDAIYASIRHLARGAEVFLPVMQSKVGEDTVTVWLLDGYGFVRRTLEDAKILRLAGTKYVSQVVTRKTGNPKGRQDTALATVTTQEINRLRQQLAQAADQGIEVGDTVQIVSGTYRFLTAEVFHDMPEEDAVQVRIKLRSNTSLITLPKAFLKLDTKAPVPAWAEPAKNLIDWVRRVRLFVQWYGSTDYLHDLWEEYQFLADLVQQMRDTSLPLHYLVTKNYNIQPLRDKYDQWRRYSALVARGKQLAPFVRAGGVAWSTKGLQQRFAKLEQLNRYITSWSSLLSDAEQLILTQLQTTHHVILDGYNLAVRCATAPGLCTLHDGKNRPTGAIVGTLNTLGVWRKRHPTAQLWVVWDGSSQRRRKMDPGYKASRGTPKPFFEIEQLKEILPLIGVKQAWNPTEEADDVMATLVRGECKDQGTVVVTTDRDMLQLVGPGVQVVCPSGKDKVYTPETVEAEYGVPVSRLIELRALVGDRSDEIPGVPGLGLKTALKVLLPHASLEALLSSDFAGCTPQIAKGLKTHKERVRLNVDLMRLLDNVPLTVIPTQPNRQAAERLLAGLQIKPRPVVFPPK